MSTILFVNHRSRRCGVHEFGNEIYGQITASARFSFVLVECDSTGSLLSEVERYAPAAIVFNYHPMTMPWAPSAAIACADVPTIGVIHDVTAEIAEDWKGPYFDRLVTHDPGLRSSNSLFVSAPRPLPRYTPTAAPPETGPIRVGSFGFASPDKGWERLVQAAQDSFDECIVRLHIPAGDFADADGTLARKLVEQCRSLIRREGVSIEVSHEFVPRDELLEFLASNHINALFYEPDRGLGGISSAADLAIASGRPMALRRGKMFREFDSAQPSIFIEDLTLAAILANGTKPLEPFRAAWTQQALVEAYEQAVASVLNASGGTPAERRRRLARMAAGYEREMTLLNQRLVETYEATVSLQGQLNAANASAQAAADEQRDVLHRMGKEIEAQRKRLTEVDNYVRQLNAENANAQASADAQRSVLLQTEQDLAAHRKRLTEVNDYVRASAEAQRSVLLQTEQDLAAHRKRLTEVNDYVRHLHSRLDGVFQKQGFFRRLEARLRHRKLKVPRFNTLLDDPARAYYEPSIATLWRLAPETMRRKIPRANVQQGFMLAAVEERIRSARSRIMLCVGSFEDTACLALQTLGYRVDAIDPELNADLDSFRRDHQEKLGTYGVVFSTSVIEHVLDDERFVRDLIDMTAVGGSVVLTCDYRDDWTPDQPKPSSDVRIYTSADMWRLVAAMPGAKLVDEPDWNAHAPDFTIEEFGRTLHYGFATLVVTKV